MTIEPWLIWLIVGVVSIIIEIFDPAVFFISFGIAGIITSLISILGLPFWVQALIFGVLSFITFLFMRRVYERLLRNGKPETNVYALIGQNGMVTATIPQDGRGEVKIGGEYWVAVSQENLEIVQGERIEVLSIDGNKLIVQKTN